MSSDPYRIPALFYDRVFGSGARRLSEITVGLADVPDGATVLDVGCGTGVLLEHCVERGLRAHGVEPSPAMMGVARQKLGETAELRAEGGDALSYDDESFDAVFATMVLHELDPVTRRATLAEMIRVTRRDGVLAVTDYHDGELQGVKGMFSRAFTTAAEIAAGRAHYAGYRHFKAHGCLPGLVARAPVTVTLSKPVSGGNLAVHILRRT